MRINGLLVVIGVHGLQNLLPNLHICNTLELLRNERKYYTTEEIDLATNLYILQMYHQNLYHLKALLMKIDAFCILQ